MCQRNSHTTCHKSLAHVRTSTPDKLAYSFTSFSNRTSERKKQITENLWKLKSLQTQNTFYTCDGKNKSNRIKAEKSGDKQIWWQSTKKTSDVKFFVSPKSCDVQQCTHTVHIHICMYIYKIDATAQIDSNGNVASR